MATARLYYTQSYDVSTIFCTLYADILTNLFSQVIDAIMRCDTLTFNKVFIDET